MYANQSDIVALYGANALVVADRDGNGVADEAAVTRALASASDEINSYLAVRYTVPVPAPAPQILIQLCVDIGVYRLALSADVLSAEHRQRYEDALAMLKRLAKGEAALVLAVDPNALPADPDATPALNDGPQPIVVGGPPRVFSREQMRGL
jgi:phage gp36-like protein